MIVNFQSWLIYNILIIIVRGEGKMKNCCVIFQVIMKGECRRRNNSLPERRKLGIKVSRDTRQSYGHQVTIKLDDHSVREKVSQPRKGTWNSGTSLILSMSNRDQFVHENLPVNLGRSWRMQEGAITITKRNEDYPVPNVRCLLFSRILVTSTALFCKIYPPNLVPRHRRRTIMFFFTV